MSSDFDTKANYKYIKEILLHVQDLPEKKQVSYVKKACNSKPELLPEILNMLNIGNSELAESMEKSPILEHVPELDTHPQNEDKILPTGTKISHYQVIEQIGAGGMGQVYSAQQNYPAERKVALKLLKETPNQQLIISETQILARLNHPNIATLYEIDKTDKGHFFIAMELIHGEDMISWCKNRSYSETQTIKLFQFVCSGIAYAHEQNIIHCDIKPSNVLVTNIDGIATVKIIDFGISQFGENTNSYHDISGTPAYMAPEVLSNQENYVPDACRDVYALGVLLKKTLPIDLSIDLQAIINKATAQNKIDRYQSVKLFNQDLSRYINKQTVSARKNSLAYKLKLLFQRRIDVVLISAAVLIISLSSAYFAQHNQAKIATQQAQAAKAAQQEAEELSKFLTGLFNVANPERGSNESVTAVDLIDKAKDKLTAIENPSLSDARFMHTIGSIYIRMDKISDAKKMIQESLTVKELELGENNNEVIDGFIQLGLIHKKLGDNANAENTLNKALKSLKSQEIHDNNQMAYVHNHLGNLYTQLQNVESSISHHKQAIELRELLDNNKLLGDSYNNLGAIYLNNKQWELASTNLYLALELYLQHYHSNHPYVGIAKNNIAYIEEKRFNYKASEKMLLEVVDIWSSAYGMDHINTEIVQRNLALFYDRRMKFDKAISIYDRLIAQFKEKNNIDKTAKYTGLKAVTYTLKQDYRMAVKYHEKVFKLIENHPPNEKYLYAKFLNRYAETLMHLKQYQKSEDIFMQTLSHLESKYSPSHYQRLYTLNKLAQMHFLKSDLSRSVDLYKQVLSYNDPAIVRNQIEQITAHIGIGKVQHANKSYLKSHESFENALIMNNKINGTNHKTNGIINYQLAQLFLSQNKTRQVKSFLNKALNIQKKSLPLQHKDLIATTELLESL